MRPDQNALSAMLDKVEQRPSSRRTLVDRFELLSAASEAEDVRLVSIIEHFAKREAVLS